MLLSLEELKQPPFYHEMILVEGGRFMMGSGQQYAPMWETPIHEVQISDFYIAKYPVTQALWKVIMGNCPSYFIGDSCPVENVSWGQTQIFIEKINQITRGQYRLPSEAEWEFAARGGKYDNGYKYAGSNKLKEVSWNKDNSHDETKPVGLKHPNELGLFDMSGNVYEWCQDQWRGNYHGASIDGSALEGMEKGGSTVSCGGSSSSLPDFCRHSSRFNWFPDYPLPHVGFRLTAPPTVHSYA